MPAARLQDQVESLSRYDVVGEYSEATRFVRHVGLASKATLEVRVGDSVPVNDSGLFGLERAGQMTAHVIGTANLTYGEVQQIETFINEHLGEQQAQDELGPKCFVIRPHARPFLDNNGTTVCMRFSCAGFVIEAYRDAGIYLLDTDEEVLPPVNRETLGKVYPHVLHRSWAKWNTEYEWGLDENKANEEGGELSWPVVLPGYVFHALQRTVGEIRKESYKPQLGDEVFP